MYKCINVLQLCVCVYVTSSHSDCFTFVCNDIHDLMNIVCGIDTNEPLLSSFCNREGGGNHGESS